MEARNWSAVVAMAALAACTGCLTKLIHIDVGDLGGSEASVVKGVAYDRAAIPEGNWERVIVPEGTKVVRADGSLGWRCIVQKKAGSIGKTRSALGAAVCRAGKSTLRIGTFGDAKSTSAVALTVYLPKSMKVEFAENQSNVKWKDHLPADAAMNAVPEEWTALVDSPDPDEAAYQRTQEAEKDAKD